MPRPPAQFRLKPQDAKELEALLHGGVQQVRVVLRALALLHLHRGASAPDVARLVQLSPQAVRKIAHRYNKVALPVLCMSELGPELPRYWRPGRSSASLQWHAVLLHAELPGGRYA